jgi:hypothetical protein
MPRMQRATLTMTPGEWRLRLAQLCQDSAMAEQGQEDTMLRLGHGLLASQPDPASTLADHLPPLARFEALLAAGAHDSAALALVPEGGSYIMSRAGEGMCMASVMLPGMAEEVTSEADSPALALVSALAAALACGGHADELAPRPDAAVDERPIGPWSGMVTPAMRHGESLCEGDGWQRPQGAMLH